MCSIPNEKHYVLHIYNGRHHGHGRAYINISRMSKRGALNSSPPHLKRFIVKVLYTNTHTHAHSVALLRLDALNRLLARVLLKNILR